jgi:hypothetical protein
MRSIGSVTGKLSRGLDGVENVRPIAAEMWEGFEAATAAVIRGTPANAGSDVQSRIWKRTMDAQQIAHASRL